MRQIALLFLSVLLFCAPAGASAATALANIKSRSDFQWRIVQFFTAKRCDLIQKMVNPEFYDWLKPNVLAIVAYCAPNGSEPEKLFQLAESKDPSGDLIFVLHAKYVWKYDREASMPLWDNVLKHARNPYLQEMAKEYLANTVEKEEDLHLSEITYQGRLRMGVAYESDPLLPYMPEPATQRPQGETNLRFAGGAQRWMPFGSLSANYTGTYKKYFADQGLDMLENQLEIPVSLRLGTYEDLVFRPFYGISEAGTKTYSTRLGMGVMGIAYRPEYKQYVQGSIYSERLLFPSVHSQEGTHFRFDYNWEFFPKSWVFQWMAFMEHVKAIHDYENGTDIKNTHTDLGGGLDAQYVWKKITWELNLGLAYRVDAEPSEFIARDSGKSIRERRSDFNVHIRPSITVPIFPYVQMQPWYEFSQNFSTLSGYDYANYNIVNHTVGVALISEFSNY